jgi:hypothetical protein
MGKPCTTWLVSCLLSLLSIPIVGCGGGSITAKTAESTAPANPAPVASTPSITWNTPAAIQYGAALSDAELNATASVPGNFAYSPAAGTVLEAGSQKLTVTFTPSDTVTYNTVTSNVQLTVTQATPAITWGPLSPIPQGIALSAAQLNATANIPGTLSYSPALGAVLSAGTQQLTATFTPADTTDYKVVKAHGSLTVTAPAPNAPAITWNTPATIQYGTALSSIQLDATASVPGTFSYSPAAGALLQAGSQKLTAIFTPADATNYSAVTSTVQLTVTQAASVITWPALSPIHQGAALTGGQLNATANVPGTFSYSPAAGAVLPQGTQQLTVTFTPANATDYTSATAVNSLTVNAANTSEPAPVNGACGAASGATSSVAPSAALCSVGTASAVTGTGPWTWQCTGANGGTSSSCMASPAPEGPSTFVQSLGINTHLGYGGTPYYGQSQSVISALQYLGINTIRDQPPGYTNDATTIASNDAVAAAGVQFDALLVGNGPVDITDTLAGVAAFEQTYPGSIAAIEGPNEINGWPITYEGITNTYAAGAKVTQDLWTAVQSNPALETVPVYALTLSYGITGVAAGEEQLGNLAPYVTYGNAHIYASSTNVWQEQMPYWLPVLEQDTPGRPTVITETGYTTTPSEVDELSAAKYNLNLLFENALNGIVRTYLYELVDENTNTSGTTVSDYYGEFHSDWTPKVGATAIHNLTTILKSAGSGTAANVFNSSVSGLPATGHSFLLGSSTAWDLAVWIDATVYNPANEVDIAAPSYPVTVNLGATYSNVAVYDPMIGPAPIATYSNVSTLSISVVDHPLIVQVN